MNKKLSILICSLQERQEKLNRLMEVLKPQINDEVEVIIKSDSRQMSIGTKRNSLLNEAKGEYIAFIDDDDVVSADYVNKILSAIESKPDCCGIQGTITFQGRCPRTFIHSLEYANWFEKDNIYYRCPNHLNPVKRELALKVGFKEVNFGEDRDYSTRLFPLLKTEIMISDSIYYYLFEKSGPPGEKSKMKHKNNRRQNKRLR